MIAIVPLKAPRHAKQRLARLLSAAERAGLARVMAEDVLTTLTAVAGISDIVLVARADTAAEFAKRMGVGLLPEPEDRGINAAIAHAARTLAHMEAGMLVVAGDVPLISPAEVEAVLAVHAAGPGVTLVPAIEDQGTNGLACSPLDRIHPQFGPQSLRRHREAALVAGLEPRVMALPGWGHDIDRPADLMAFAATPSATRTYAFVVEHGIDARLHTLIGC